MPLRTTNFSLPSNLLEKLNKDRDTSQPMHATVLGYNHQEMMVELPDGQTLRVPGTVFTGDWTGNVTSGSKLVIDGQGRVTDVIASHNEPENPNSGARKDPW